MLLIDDREPDQVYQHIYDCPAWSSKDSPAIRVERLNVEGVESGDFAFHFYDKPRKTWTPWVGIESKTWSDLLGSMSHKQDIDIDGRFRRGRIYSQLTRLAASYPTHMLLVKGRLETHTHDINPMERQVRLRNSGQSYFDSPWQVKHARGLLAAVQRRGTIVEYVEHADELPWVLRFLHDHYESHRDDVDHFFRGINAVPHAMLDVVPRITPKLAERLHAGLDTTPRSIAGVIQATQEELAQYLPPIAAKELYGRLH